MTRQKIHKNAQDAADTPRLLGGVSHPLRIFSSPKAACAVKFLMSGQCCRVQYPAFYHIHLFRVRDQI